MMISDKVSCNNRKDCRYIVGYQVDEALMPLFIKTPKKIFTYGVSQYDGNSVYRMPFNVSEAKKWVSQYKNIWKEVESQLFEKLTARPKKERANTSMVSRKYRQIFMAKMRHVLQCNSSVKDRFYLQTR